MGDADRVTAYLAEVRNAAAIAEFGTEADLALSGENVPRLLTAVEAALGLATPDSEPDRDLDGNPEGGVTYYVTCDRLRRAITTALLGEEPSDGRA